MVASVEEREVVQVSHGDLDVRSFLVARVEAAVRSGDVVAHDAGTFTLGCQVDDAAPDDAAVVHAVRRRVRRALRAPVALPSGTTAVIDLRSVRVEVAVRRGGGPARRRRAEREVEDFALLAAHDLKSPLCTLGVLADLLDRRAHDVLDEQAQEWLAHLRAGVRRMGSLVDGVLAYCGVVEDEAPGPVDLGTLASDVVEMLSAEVERSGGEVVVDPLPVVRGDARQLALVLQNLIGNALKFVPAGARPSVRVSAVEEGDRWRIRVDDSGIGVPEQHRRRIFEMFQRVRGPEHFEGVGIGLSTAARVVERHGGALWVEDAPGGRGARFTFTMPAW